MSNYKFVLNDEFKNFKDFLINIKNYFKENRNTIHKARNEIKVIEHENQKLVVKSFKKPNFLNRVVYTFYRSSKAKKSYEYALKIKDFTPKPIGYIEFFTAGLIDESYFISECFEYDYTIREPLLNKDFPKKEKILKAFARFTYELHENEIFHLDYSPGNILIKEEGENFIFKIVDINRMRFGKLSLNQKMKNFSKLWISDEDLEIVINEYSKMIGLHEKTLFFKALNFSNSNKKVKNFKKRLKGKKVVD
ncbi:hypothetical protein ACIB15232_0452 [Aliarcobacter cibarius]|uniref:lipopolysaccharide kinase InaA family protein n=1 Tax=Aliarcobacter cibarius TaxID=255507 RepID=UPI001248D0D8|nr:lipopolysaccharide kinase InaA family protein [Aliarcobacter cibarius]QEZ88623.1 hypothetical protein ACIB15232_0452 [Aliarcobacter cibarius]